MKITKKIFLIIFAVFFIIGCKNKEEKLKEINMSYVKGPLSIPSILEKNLGTAEKEFEAEGIKVNFHDVTSGPQQVQALMAGDLDVLHAFGGTSAIISASNGAEFTVINVYSRSPKGFMLVSNSDEINSPQDLRGKKIAGPKGTILHQLLAAYLEKAGMTTDDVQFINMKVNDAEAALESRLVDAVLLTGPSAENALKRGAEVITDGEGLVQGIIVTAVSNDFLKKYPHIVERIVKLNEKTADFIKNNSDETVKIVSRETGLSEEEVRKMKEIYDFNPQIKESDIEELKNTQEFLIKSGLQENRVDIDKLILKK